jgi:transketolase
MRPATPAITIGLSLTDNFDPVVSRERCRWFRERILTISQTIPALHIAPAFSCLEILDAIYYGVLRGRPSDDTSDTVLLSKGHGCMAQYVILQEQGVLSPDDLRTFCTPEGRLGAHPDYGTPGIAASTGSLGHGLGMALGMCLADRVHHMDRRVFVVLSDGELQEGSVWEALLLAPTLKLHNLIGVVDLNDFQSLGQTSKMHPNFYPVVDKLRAFGWETAEVDGHAPAEIIQAIRGRVGDRPMMVVAHTVKGKGVSFMENAPIWHYRSPSKDEYAVALQEISNGHA